MIQVFAPCCIPFQLPMTLHGSTGNTVLPDPMLGSVDWQGTPVLINKSIGDDLELRVTPAITMYKAYDLLGDVLYEYSLFQLAIPGTQEPFYTPISVKRYDTHMPYTFLYPRGVTLALDTLRGTRNYNIISATVLVKMFSGSPINFVDTSFSIEHPSLMENILSELGSYALHDPADSDTVMRQLFSELTVTYDQQIAYDQPKDIISYYACTPDTLMPQAKILQHIEPSTNGFYSQYAYDMKQKLLERANSLTPLDLQQTVFWMMQIPNIISEIYQAPYTDISMVVEQGGARDVHTQLLFGVQRVPPPDAAQAWANLTPDIAIATYLHDGMIHFNQHQPNRIHTVVLSKNWMDDFHLDTYMEDGTCVHYYLNLALYHLYSPSIVRLHNSIQN